LANSWRCWFFLFKEINKLTGFIPNEIMGLPSISVGLDLSYNLLERPLFSKVGNLINIEQLRLSRNKLSGEIPIPLATAESWKSYLWMTIHFKEAYLLLPRTWVASLY
jgi:hypothetical protein